MSGGQDGDMESGVRSLLEVNNLGFRMTPGMSVATSRVTREWSALRAEYKEGDILTFAISSGAAYVDPDNSYITFDMEITTTGANVGNTYHFFWGSDTEGRQNALNLFRDMRYTHSSGYEVDRITRGFAPWKYIQNAYTKDREWHETVGSLMRGYQTSGRGTIWWGSDGSGGAWPRAFPEYTPGPTDADKVFAAANANFDAGVTIPGAKVTINNPTMRPFAKPDAIGTIVVRVSIPLSCISGVWDTDQLSPSFLMAGSRLELTLQSHQQVFQVRGGVGGLAPVRGNYSYLLRNPKIVLETITFTDAVLRSISMTSANVGLEIPFIAMHQTTAPILNDDMSVQVNRALSRANLIIARVYPNTAQDDSDRCCQLDSVASYFVAPTAQGWQVKLGAEFMPSAPINDPLALYHATQTAFGNWKADRRNTVRMIDFVGSGSMAPAAGVGISGFCPYATLGCMGMTLEKSSTLAQSGSPISAARDLSIVFGGSELGFFTDPLWNRLSVDIFVPYVTLATVYLDSVLTRS